MGRWATGFQLEEVTQDQQRPGGQAEMHEFSQARSDK